MFPDDIQAMAQTIMDAASAAGVTVATAESCTGGLIASALTAVPGSSAVVDRGFVTYSNAAKIDLLGVPAALIADHGAVSEDVARAMAEGTRMRSGVDIALSVTGIAGPGGGSGLKPVGLVHFACCTGAGTEHREHRFGDIGRETVRLESVRVGLGLILDGVRRT